MRTGRVSKTALKLALITTIVADREDWDEPLPDGAGALSERLLLAADQPMYRAGTIRLMKSWLGRLSTNASRTPYCGAARRRCFMDLAVLGALEHGATQVLILGAGFDTLGLRLAPRFPHVQFFEVDYPATSAAKGRGIDAVGRPANLRQIAADLGESRLRDVLDQAAGWDSQARTAVVAEGLLMYLTHDQTADLFAQLTSNIGPGSRVAFSHLLDLASHGAMTLWALRTFGEPWLSSWTHQELPAAIAALGWRVLDQSPEQPGVFEAFAVVEVDR